MVNKENIRLWDFTQGRQGNFIEKVETLDSGAPVTGDGSDTPEKVVKIKYYPDVDIMKSPLRWLKALFGQATPRVTSQKFPESAVYRLNFDGTIPGQARSYMVIEEDQYGNAEALEKMELKREDSLARLQRKKEKSDAEKDKKELENLNQSGENNQDSEYRRGRRRRFRDDEALGEEFAR